MSFPPSADVAIREVSARPGIHPATVMARLEDKVTLIDGLAQAGLPRIEVAVFRDEKPSKGPDDADEVMNRLVRRVHTVYSVTVADSLGVKRAAQTHPDEMTVFMAASETENWRRVGRTITQSLADTATICEVARQYHVPVGVLITGAFGGADAGGEVSAPSVMELAYRLYGLGIREITLADTAGVAHPVLVQRRVRMLRDNLPGITIGLQLADTHSAGMDNLMAALDAGATCFDTVLGGMVGSVASGTGGCLATEDVAQALEKRGVRTGVDTNRLLELGDWLSQIVGHPLLSQLRQAHGRIALPPESDKAAD